MSESYHILEIKIWIKVKHLKYGSESSQSICNYFNQVFNLTKYMHNKGFSIMFLDNIWSNKKKY